MAVHLFTYELVRFNHVTLFLQALELIIELKNCSNVNVNVNIKLEYRTWYSTLMCSRYLIMDAKPGLGMWQRVGKWMHLRCGVTEKC